MRYGPIRLTRAFQARENFLPFSSNFGLSREEFLSQLPQSTDKVLRILCPEGFFTPAFLNHLQSKAAAVGAKFEYNFAGQREFFAALGDPSVSKRYDFILSIYAASERYPAVQLRYLTPTGAKSEIELKEAEAPDYTGDRSPIFKTYEKWLLKERLAIPIYFNVTLFAHKNSIDIGDQSKSDAEVELWRLQESGE